jgi:hypothetical protein
MILRKSRILCLILVLSTVWAAFGAEITVPRIELATRGASADGEFAFSAKTVMDISLTGKDKYGILLGLSLESANLGKALAYRNFAFSPFGYGPLTPGAASPTSLTDDDYIAYIDQQNSYIDHMNERLNNQAALSFRIAKASLYDLFKMPLELSLFAGITDSFCSGSEFATRLGGVDIASDFTGFYYFPEGIGGNPYRHYDGIHSVQGIGLSLALTKWQTFVPMLYLYQDYSFRDSNGFLSEKSHFSGDFRFLVNIERFKFEAFGGISGSKNEKPDFRGGALAYFSSGSGTDFLLQAGIPAYIQDDSFSIDNLYFLMEPRITFGHLALHVTFFYHPVEYLHVKADEERGKADINIKLLAGNAERSGIEGGFEVTTGLKVYGNEDLIFKLSPFVAFVSNGLRWDIKLRVNPLLWEHPEELFEIFAGIKTVY